MALIAFENEKQMYAFYASRNLDWVRNMLKSVFMRNNKVVLSKIIFRNLFSYFKNKYLYFKA